MADNKINFIIDGKANFQPVYAELSRLKEKINEVSVASRSVNNLNINTSSLKSAQRDFATQASAIRGVRVEMVNLSDGAAHLSDRLLNNKRSFSDMVSTWRAGSKHMTDDMRRIGDYQAKLHESMVLPSAVSDGQAMVVTNFAKTADAALRTTKTMQAYNTEMLNLGNKMVNFGKNTQWAGRQLTVGFTVPLLAAGGAISAMFLKVDEAMRKLMMVYGVGGGAGQGFQNIVPSVEELEKIKNGVYKLSQEMASLYGQSADATTAVAADLAAAGYTQQQLLDMTKIATNAMVLGQTDQQSAVKATIAIQNAYKLNVNQTTEALQFFSAAQAATSTNMQDLIDSVPRVGPIIKNLGGTYKDTVAMIVAMKEGGVAAGEGANALKNSMQRIVAPTESAKKTLKSFGIQLDDIAKSGSPVIMIQKLQDALSKLDAVSRQQAITELFGKFQAARMTALLDNFNRAGTQSAKVMEMMSLSADQLGQIQERQIQALQESPSMRFQAAIEGLKAKLIPIGEKLIEIVTPLINGITWVISALDKIGPIKYLLAGGLGFTAILGPLIMFGGLISNLIGQMFKISQQMRMFKEGFSAGGGLAKPFTSLAAGLKATQNYLEEFDAAQHATERSIDALTDSTLVQAESFRELAKALAEYREELERISRGGPGGGMPGGPGGPIIGGGGGYPRLPTGGPMLPQGIVGDASRPIQVEAMDVRLRDPENNRGKLIPASGNADITFAHMRPKRDTIEGSNTLNIPGYEPSSNAQGTFGIVPGYLAGVIGADFNNTLKDKPHPIIPTGMNTEAMVRQVMSEVGVKNITDEMVRVMMQELSLENAGGVEAAKLAQMQALSMLQNDTDFMARFRKLATMSGADAEDVDALFAERLGPVWEQMKVNASESVLKLYEQAQQEAMQAIEENWVSAPQTTAEGLGLVAGRFSELISEQIMNIASTYSDKLIKSMTINSPDLDNVTEQMKRKTAVRLVNAGTTAQSMMNPFMDALESLIQQTRGLVTQMTSEARMATANIASMSARGAMQGIVGIAKETSRPPKPVPPPGLPLATGGKVYGPGGPKDDLIPALLSDGEYVVRADAVGHYGSNFLDAVNNKKLAGGGILRRANGGIANFEGGSGKDRDRIITYDIDNTIADTMDPSIMEELAARKKAGEKISKWDLMTDSGIIGSELARLMKFKAAGFKVVLVTARPESQRANTESWLARAGVPYDELRMLHEGLRSAQSKPLHMADLQQQGDLFGLVDDDAATLEAVAAAGVRTIPAYSTKKPRDKLGITPLGLFGGGIARFAEGSGEQIIPRTRGSYLGRVKSDTSESAIRFLNAMRSAQQSGNLQSLMYQFGIDASVEEVEGLIESGQVRKLSAMFAGQSSHYVGGKKFIPGGAGFTPLEVNQFFRDVTDATEFKGGKDWFNKNVALVSNLNPFIKGIIDRHGQPSAGQEGFKEAEAAEKLANIIVSKNLDIRGYDDLTNTTMSHGIPARNYFRRLISQGMGAYQDHMAAATDFVDIAKGLEPAFANGGIAKFAEGPEKSNYTGGYSATALRALLKQPLTVFDSLTPQEVEEYLRSEESPFYGEDLDEFFGTRRAADEGRITSDVHEGWPITFNPIQNEGEHATQASGPPMTWEEEQLAIAMRDHAILNKETWKSLDDSTVEAGASRLREHLGQFGETIRLYRSVVKSEEMADIAPGTFGMFDAFLSDTEQGQRFVSFSTGLRVPKKFAKTEDGLTSRIVEMDVPVEAIVGYDKLNYESGFSEQEVIVDVGRLAGVPIRYINPTGLAGTDAEVQIIDDKGEKDFFLRMLSPRSATKKPLPFESTGSFSLAGSQLISDIIQRASQNRYAVDQTSGAETFISTFRELPPGEERDAAAYGITMDEIMTLKQMLEEAYHMPIEELKDSTNVFKFPYEKKAAGIVATALGLSSENSDSIHITDEPGSLSTTWSRELLAGRPKLAGGGIAKFPNGGFTGGYSREAIEGLYAAVGKTAPEFTRAMTEEQLKEYLASPESPFYGTDLDEFFASREAGLAGMILGDHREGWQGAPFQLEEGFVPPNESGPVFKTATQRVVASDPSRTEEERMLAELAWRHAHEDKRWDTVSQEQLDAGAATLRQHLAQMGTHMRLYRSLVVSEETAANAPGNYGIFDGDLSETENGQTILSFSTSPRIPKNFANPDRLGHTPRIVEADVPIEAIVAIDRMNYDSEQFKEQEVLVDVRKLGSTILRYVNPTGFAKLGSKHLDEQGNEVRDPSFGSTPVAATSGRGQEAEFLEMISPRTAGGTEAILWDMVARGYRGVETTSSMETSFLEQGMGSKKTPEEEAELYGIAQTEIEMAKRYLEQKYGMPIEELKKLKYGTLFDKNDPELKKKRASADALVRNEAMREAEIRERDRKVLDMVARATGLRNQVGGFPVHVTETPGTKSALWSERRITGTTSSNPMEIKLKQWMADNPGQDPAKDAAAWNAYQKWVKYDSIGVGPMDPSHPDFDNPFNNPDWKPENAYLKQQWMESQKSKIGLADGGIAKFAGKPGQSGFVGGYSREALEGLFSAVGRRYQDPGEKVPTMTEAELEAYLMSPESPYYGMSVEEFFATRRLGEEGLHTGDYHKGWKDLGIKLDEPTDEDYEAGTPHYRFKKSKVDLTEEEQRLAGLAVDHADGFKTIAKEMSPDQVDSAAARLRQHLAKDGATHMRLYRSLVMTPENLAAAQGHFGMMTAPPSEFLGEERYLSFSTDMRIPKNFTAMGKEGQTPRIIEVDVPIDAIVAMDRMNYDTTSAGFEGFKEQEVIVDSSKLIGVPIRYVTPVGLTEYGELQTRGLIGKEEYRDPSLQPVQVVPNSSSMKDATSTSGEAQFLETIAPRASSDQTKEAFVTDLLARVYSGKHNDEGYGITENEIEFAKRRLEEVTGKSIDQITDADFVKLPDYQRLLAIVKGHYGMGPVANLQITDMPGSKSTLWSPLAVSGMAAANGGLAQFANGGIIHAMFGRLAKPEGLPGKGDPNRTEWIQNMLELALWRRETGEPARKGDEWLIENYGKAQLRDIQGRESNKQALDERIAEQTSTYPRQASNEGMYEATMEGLNPPGMSDADWDRTMQSQYAISDAISRRQARENDRDRYKVGDGYSGNMAMGGFLSHFAGGGKAFGPGGPKDDLIPAMISNGEYVINADAVGHYGVSFIDAINAKKLASGGIAGFAEGTEGGMSSADYEKGAFFPGQGRSSQIDITAMDKFEKFDMMMGVAGNGLQGVVDLIMGGGDNKQLISGLMREAVIMAKGFTGIKDKIGPVAARAREFEDRQVVRAGIIMDDVYTVGKTVNESLTEYAKRLQEAKKALEEEIANRKKARKNKEELDNLEGSDKEELPSRQTPASRLFDEENAEKQKNADAAKMDSAREALDSIYEKSGANKDEAESIAKKNREANSAMLEEILSQKEGKPVSSEEMFADIDGKPINPIDFGRQKPEEPISMEPKESEPKPKGKFGKLKGLMSGQTGAMMGMGIMTGANLLASQMTESSGGPTAGSEALSYGMNAYGALSMFGPQVALPAAAAAAVLGAALGDSAQKQRELTESIRKSVQASKDYRSTLTVSSDILAQMGLQRKSLSDIRIDAPTQQANEFALAVNQLADAMQNGSEATKGMINSLKNADSDEQKRILEDQFAGVLAAGGTIEQAKQTVAAAAKSAGMSNSETKRYLRDFTEDIDTTKFAEGNRQPGKRSYEYLGFKKDFDNMKLPDALEAQKNLANVTAKALGESAFRKQDFQSMFGLGTFNPATLALGPLGGINQQQIASLTNTDQAWGERIMGAVQAMPGIVAVKGFLENWQDGGFGSLFKGENFMANAGMLPEGFSIEKFNLDKIRGKDVNINDMITKSEELLKQTNLKTGKEILESQDVMVQNFATMAGVTKDMNIDEAAAKISEFRNLLSGIDDEKFAPLQRGIQDLINAGDEFKTNFSDKIVEAMAALGPGELSQVLDQAYDQIKDQPEAIRQSLEDITASMGEEFKPLAAQFDDTAEAAKRLIKALKVINELPLSDEGRVIAAKAIAEDKSGALQKAAQAQVGFNSESGIDLYNLQNAVGAVETAAQIRERLSAAMKALSKQFKKDQEAAQEAFKEQQKAGQEQIKGIQKEMEARQKLYDLKQKTIQQDQTMMNLQNEISKARNAGDLLALAAAQNSYNNELNKQNAEKAKEKADDADKAKIENIQKRMEKEQEAFDARMKAMQDAFDKKMESMQNEMDNADKNAEKAKERAAKNSGEINKEFTAIMEIVSTKKLSQEEYEQATEKHVKKIARLTGRSSEEVYKEIEGTYKKGQELFQSGYHYEADGTITKIGMKNSKVIVGTDGSIKLQVAPGEQFIDVNNSSEGMGAGVDESQRLSRRYADGGHIRGPGSETSDSIPAMLSDGEYVVKARSVKKYGTGFLDAINAGHYANGGIIRKYADGSPGGVRGPNQWPHMPGEAALGTGKIPGTDTSITMRREVLPLFLALGKDYNESIASIYSSQTGAYDPRSDRPESERARSNHPSGTALDINWSREGAKTDSRSLYNWWATGTKSGEADYDYKSSPPALAAQRLKSKYRIVDWFGPQNLGGYISGTPDYMHWQITQSRYVGPDEVAATERALGIENNIAPGSISSYSAGLGTTTSSSVTTAPSFSDFSDIGRTTILNMLGFGWENAGNAMVRLPAIVGKIGSGVTATPFQYNGERYITGKPLVDLIKSGGWTGQDVRIGYGIVMGESGGDTQGKNFNKGYASGAARDNTDWGLWQINDYWNRDVNGEIVDWSRITDPVYNTHIARQSFIRAGGLKDADRAWRVEWNSYRDKTSAYQEGLKAFDKLGVSMATGGKIYGEGGPTDDKIPAMLSNGEYVVKANSVKKYGTGFMDSINAGRFHDGGIAGYPHPHPHPSWVPSTNSNNRSNDEDNRRQNNRSNNTTTSDGGYHDESTRGRQREYISTYNNYRAAGYGSESDYFARKQSGYYISDQELRANAERARREDKAADERAEAIIRNNKILAQTRRSALSSFLFGVGDKPAGQRVNRIDKLKDDVLQAKQFVLDNYKRLGMQGPREILMAMRRGLGTRMPLLPVNTSRDNLEQDVLDAKQYSSEDYRRLNLSRLLPDSSNVRRGLGTRMYNTSRDNLEADALMARYFASSRRGPLPDPFIPFNKRPPFEKEMNISEWSVDERMRMRERREMYERDKRAQRQRYFEQEKDNNFRGYFAEQYLRPPAWILKENNLAKEDDNNWRGNFAAKAVDDPSAFWLGLSMSAEDLIKAKKRSGTLKATDKQKTIATWMTINQSDNKPEESLIAHLKSKVNKDLTATDYAIYWKNRSLNKDYKTGQEVDTRKMQVSDRHFRSSWHALHLLHLIKKKKLYTAEQIREEMEKADPRRKWKENGWILEEAPDFNNSSGNPDYTFRMPKSGSTGVDKNGNPLDPYGNPRPSMGNPTTSTSNGKVRVDRYGMPIPEQSDSGTPGIIGNLLGKTYVLTNAVRVLSQLYTNPYAWFPAGAMATGGKVVGPGGPTADSILTRLSNGEFVMSAAAVNKYGVDLMTLINEGKFNPTLQKPKSYIGNPSSSEKTGNISNNNIEYNVNVTVEGTNSSPEDIAKVVIKTLKQKEQANMTHRRIG